ncbi:hypothetical protein ACFQFH_01910 [Halobaculum halobium]|uniref:hypothetical protein n=1 Tax=Halobaculum halobium TaxID=3032281 RepID=UPI003607EBCE
MIRGRLVADGGVEDDRSAESVVAGPGAAADARRCGCAGKTPLDRVVLPARERVASALEGTSVRLGPDSDAAVLDSGVAPAEVERAVEGVALGDERPAVPFDGDADGRQVVTLACAFVGDDFADPDRLGDALATAYAGLDGPEVTIGKGHAVQIPDIDGGFLWLEHLRATEPTGSTDETHSTDAGARGVAANLDAVHAFPDLPPPEQARIAALNACNDVYASGATADRIIRPVVAAPADARPSPGRVTDWFRAGLPADATVLSGSVLTHEGESWVLGASVVAGGRTSRDEPSLPTDCDVLVTRPLGGLAAFALGTLSGDSGLRALGRDRLGRDALPVAAALAACRPDPKEPFDPARHVARVTDVSGEGIAGVGRLAARDGRSLRLDRLPLHDAVASTTADRWAIPDATVETNGPFAVIATPSALARVTERLRDVAGANPVRIGTLDRADEPILDATGADLSRFVEAAARWPRAGDAR